ncbi:MmgE/PrpD family protein [Ramlibacter sp. G-1-2-2]|uniref:MmgE/PrpD family protein n=1 Tax=Ramlibacter agri TaxID=2728837 RepID=A0A848H897_9BURK|nr:MmgE/PrpD family protein [Ramlibacter agri]NML45729.1 MmgE/PrpD family protein [Ramlibacter agri]
MIEALGRQLREVAWRKLSEPARRKLLLCLLANLSVAVAGRSALRLPRPAAGSGHLLLDGGETGSAREAAFFNGALMHARTQDDFHPAGNLHIATLVLPALLAEAERREVTGETFLDAMAVGYACAVGLSRRFSPLNTPRGLRSTCLYAGMGAAAAVARLRGQDARAIGNTVALASQSSFGTTQCWRDGSDEYQLHAANAASQALLCAELTEAGVAGGAHALDGPSGFYPALLGRTPSFEEIAPDFEPDAAIVESVLKRYPVSGICQPVVRLTEKLARQLAGRRIEKVRVEMNAFEMNYPGTLNAGPEFRSFSDRLMSARFCAASVLEAGRFDFDAFLRPLSREASRLVAATDVEAAQDLGTLSCRVTLAVEGGEQVAGELRDGGKELAIEWDTITAWTEELWSAAGRSAAACERARKAVLALPNTGFRGLRAALE